MSEDFVQQLIDKWWGKQPPTIPTPYRPRGAALPVATSDQVPDVRDEETTLDVPPPVAIKDWPKRREERHHERDIEVFRREFPTRRVPDGTMQDL